MADILIRGVEMPKDQHTITITICYDGYAVVEFRDIDCYPKAIEAYEATPLPEGHGRLIDADALLDESCDVIEDHSGLDYVDPCPIWGYSANMISHAPTIVPAEGGGKDG